MEAGEKTGPTIGTALLTHDIPRGPELLTPEEDEEVPEDEDLLVSWELVDETIDGADVEIIAYQLIIEKDEEPHLLCSPCMVVFSNKLYVPWQTIP